MKIKIVIAWLLISAVAFSQGTVIDTFFYSPSLASNRNVDVYLPEGYDPAGSLDYPVIYFLHGAGGNNNSYPELIGILDSLIENQVIDPVIVVKPDGYIGPYAGSMWTNSELYGEFEDYVVYELVEFIEASFNAYTDRIHRCIMGHSMGGIGCMKLALKHPDIYIGVASLSGALDLNAGIPLWIPHILNENGGSPPYNYSPFGGVFSLLTFTAAGAFSPNLDNLPYMVDFPLDSQGNEIDSVYGRWLAHNPANLASSLPPDCDLSIYFDCGTLDHLEFYPMNTAFAETLDCLGIDYEFQTFLGDHYSITRPPIAFDFLDSVMKSATSIADKESPIPEIVRLSQNFPNPFNASTSISFALTEQTAIKLEIFNLLGQRVAAVAEGELLAGHYRITWNASNQASGVYYCSLRVEGFTETKKMILIK